MRMLKTCVAQIYDEKFFIGSGPVVITAAAVRNKISVKNDIKTT